MDPLVSIIVPVYNAEEYFPKCIDSILKQTYSRLEILLVDDGSKDKSGELCDKYAKHDKRVFVHHQQHLGVSKARNWALNQARGEYIVFVDADDIIAPDLVSICLTASVEKGADIVVFGLQRIYKDISGTEIQFQRIKFNLIENSESIRKKILINKISNFLVTGFYKSYLWKDIRLPSYSSHEDLYILPRIFVKAQQVIKIDNILYYYNRTNSQSLSSDRGEFDARKRYYKFKAYDEHRFWASQLNDQECFDWAMFHMMWDAIKIYYVNFYSSNKLTSAELGEIVQFIKDNWTASVKAKMNKKMVILRWATLYRPCLCKVYGFIRYKQESLKWWLKDDTSK